MTFHVVQSGNIVDAEGRREYEPLERTKPRTYENDWSSIPVWWWVMSPFWHRCHGRIPITTAERRRRHGAMSLAMIMGALGGMP